MSIDPSFRALGFCLCGEGREAGLFPTALLTLGPGFRRDDSLRGRGGFEVGESVR